MSLFRRPIDFTTLFNTRKDNRTNLFFTPDQAGPDPNASTIDATMTINGYDVTVSGLDYTYVETSRTNDTGAILYYAQGTFSNPADLIINGTAYPSLPGTKTAPFTNPDPSTNPQEDTTTADPHPELDSQVFSACLWKQSDNTTSILYTVTRTLSVGTTFNDATLSVKTFNSSTNFVTLQLKVDTTYNSSWFDIQSATTLFDYDTNKFSDPLFQSTTGLYTYTENANAGGHTAPFDQRYSLSFTDTTPYYSGNFVIWEWSHQVVAYDNLSNFVGNGVFSLTNSAAVAYASAKAMTITDSVIPWIGVNSFTVTESTAVIVKSYPEWTDPYLLQHTHGGTTNYYTITGGVTTIDFSTLSPPITPTNNDVFEIIQPISGLNLSLTYQKDFTVAYTGTPPNDWTVTVTSVGINLPYTIDIEDVTNTKLDHLVMNSSTEVFDIRALPLVASHAGHTHVDWYGFGTVYFKHSGITKTFDASYIQEADGDRLSGAEIQGFNVTITNNPYTYTYGDTGKLYEGDSYTAFNSYGNEYTYADMDNITRFRYNYDESYQHEFSSAIFKISSNPSGTTIFWSFNYLDTAKIGYGTLGTVDRLDTLGAVYFVDSYDTTYIRDRFGWNNDGTVGYWLGYNSSTNKNIVEQWSASSAYDPTTLTFTSRWTLTTNYGAGDSLTDFVAIGTDLLLLQINGTINKYDITTFPPSNTPTQTDTSLAASGGYSYPAKSVVSLQIGGGNISLATVLSGQTAPYSPQDNFLNIAPITGTDLTTIGSDLEITYENRPFNSVWLRDFSTRYGYVAAEDYIFYESAIGSRHNVLSKTLNINQPQKYISPTLYSTETNIPFLHRTFFSYLVDTTPDYGSDYLYSEQVTTTGSFDVGDTFLKAVVETATFSNGYLSLLVVVNTAQNNVWRKLKDAFIQADYNTSKMTLASFTGLNSYTLTSIGNSVVPPYDKAATITHLIGLAGGDFGLGYLLFEFTEDITDADITELRFGTMRDVTTTWKTNKVITPKTFSLTWQGITSFTYTATTIEITKTVTNAFNWSYRIAGGSIVNVTGAFGLTQSVSVSLSNGQLIEVFQPYFGTTLTDTTSGIGTSRIFKATFNGATFPSGNDIDPTGGTTGLTYTRSAQYEVPTQGLGDYSAVAGTMTISNLTELNNMPSGRTFSIWFKHTALVDKALFTTSSYGTAGQGVKFDIVYLGLNGIGFQVSSSASDYIYWGATSPITNVDEWHHIFVSISNTSATIVLNGEYRGLGIPTGSFDLSNWVSGQSITLGDASLGFIDHFSFYDGVPSGMTTSPISLETDTFYTEDTPLGTDELRLTFEADSANFPAAQDIDPYGGNYQPNYVRQQTQVKVGSWAGSLTNTNSDNIRLGSATYPTPCVQTLQYTVSLWGYYQDLNSSTIDAFISSDNYTGNAALGTEGSFAFYFNQASGGYDIVLWRRTDSFVTSRTTAVIPTAQIVNQWVHFTFVINGDDIDIYLNGDSFFSDTYPPTTSTSAKWIYVGGSFFSTSVDWNRYVDDIRIYPYSMGSREAKLLYDSY